MRLCIKFVLWTNVMGIVNDEKNDRNINVSSSIDDYKKEIDGRFLSDEKLSIDDFLVQNIEYVDQKLQVMRDPVKEKLESNIQELNHLNLEISHLCHEKNWGGKNPEVKLDYSSDTESSKSCTSESYSDSDYEYEVKKENDYIELSHQEIVESVCQELLQKTMDDKPCHAETVETRSTPEKYGSDDCGNVGLEETVKKRGKYLRRCPEIQLKLQKPTKKCRKRSVIQNYNLLKSKSISKNRLSVLSTSFFDCIIEMITSVYYNIFEFQHFVDNTNATYEGTKQEFFVLFQSYVEDY